MQEPRSLLKELRRQLDSGVLRNCTSVPGEAADTEESLGRGGTGWAEVPGPSSAELQHPVPSGRAQLCPYWQEGKGALVPLMHRDQEAHSDLREPARGWRCVGEV